jgi:nitrate/nitrite transporter NarK
MRAHAKFEKINGGKNMGDIAHGEHPYRWMILAVMSVTFFLINFTQFQLAGVAGHLLPALHLTPMEFGMCLFAPYLVNFVFGLPIGMLTDRYGAKAVGIVFLIIACIGAVGRAYASASFTTLFVWMLLFGFALTFVNGMGPKILGGWFKHEHMSMAMGVFIGVAGGGIAVGEGTASLFPTITGAFTCAWIFFVLVTIWFILGFKARPDGAPVVPPQPVLEYLGVAARNKYVWLAGSAVLFFFAAWVGTAGNIPLALIHAKGLDPVTAGLVGMALGLAGAVGGILGPMIVLKLGVARIWLPVFIVVGAICIFVSIIIPFGAQTTILLIAGGFIASAMLPLTIPFPVMLREIGTTYAGSAGGIVSLLQTGGGFFIPSFVIAMIAGADAIKTFIVLLVLFVLSAVLILFLPERGFHHA